MNKTLDDFYIYTDDGSNPNGFLGACYAIKYKGYDPDEVDILKTLILNLSHHDVKEIRHDDEKLVIIDYEGYQYHLGIGKIFVIEESTGDFFILDSIAFKKIFKHAYEDENWDNMEGDDA